MKALPTRLAHELEPQQAQHRWLIEDLWADQGVGIIGGEPKCYKSFLALDIAVAVASGAPCLGRFAAPRLGPVLLYAAEDALHVVRSRLAGICASAGLAFDHLPVHVITESTVRIDLEDDRQRLRETVIQVGPRLLVLDPFVRLHRVDENAAADVAPLLAYLRELQRSFQMAVVLVHHARKSGHARGGQALRGSSELHAWGDSNLYLRHKQQSLWMSIEHRAAPAVSPLALELYTDGDAVALRPMKRPPAHDEVPRAPTDRVLDALTRERSSMSRRALRDACRMRAASVGEALRTLVASGRVIEDDAGYRIA